MYELNPLELAARAMCVILVKILGHSQVCSSHLTGRLRLPNTHVSRLFRPIQIEAKPAISAWNCGRGVRRGAVAPYPEWEPPGPGNFRNLTLKCVYFSAFLVSSRERRSISRYAQQWSCNTQAGSSQIINGPHALNPPQILRLWWGLSIQISPLHSQYFSPLILNLTSHSF